MIKRLLFSARIFIIAFLLSYISLLAYPALAQLPVSGDGSTQNSNQTSGQTIASGIAKFNEPCYKGYDVNGNLISEVKCAANLKCVKAEPDNPNSGTACQECGIGPSGEDEGSCLRFDATAICIAGVCVSTGGNDGGRTCKQDSNCTSHKCGTDNKCTEPAKTGGGGNGNQGGGGSQGTPDYSGGVNLTIDDIYNIILAIACNAQRGGLVLAVIAVIWIGYQYIYHAGNPGKLVELQRQLMYVVVGIVVIASVYTLIATIALNLGVKNFSALSCDSGGSSATDSGSGAQVTP